MKYKYVDLFAGAGGLGEGFSRAGFEPALSCDADKFCVETLTLRHFLHSFDGDFPSEYYSFLRGELSLETLFDSFPEKRDQACLKVLCFKMEKGKSNQKLHRLIRRNVADAPFVLLGGPPCQAYSLAGRSRRLGVRGLENERQERVTAFFKDEKHTLYKHYLEVLAFHKPEIFIMENVKGLLSARKAADGSSGEVFEEILNGLAEPARTVKSLGMDMDDIGRPLENLAYKLSPLSQNCSSQLYLHENPVPGDFLIDASEFGVPQKRERVFILGIRTDINIQELSLLRDEKVCVRDAIGHLPILRSGLSKSRDNWDEWKRNISESVETYFSGFRFEQQAQETSKNIQSLNSPLSRGAAYIQDQTTHPQKSKLENFLKDEKIDGWIQHETRGHLSSDILRYLLCAVMGEQTGRSPKIEDWTGNLEHLRPKHKNILTEEGALRTSVHSDRFRVQVWDQPSTTVTSHISKDGHYFIHPDPLQARSLTVREAARLQTFPDNYFFCGPRTEQYRQVGNAVPTYLAYQIAKTLKKSLREKHWMTLPENQDEMK